MRRSIGTLHYYPNGGLDLRREDPRDQDLFNRVLWAMIKGPERPYPGTRRLAFQSMVRGN